MGWLLTYIRWISSSGNKESRVHIGNDSENLPALDLLESSGSKSPERIA
jgi:hypothetical protein